MLKTLNLVLIPGAKLDGHGITWTGCTKCNRLLTVATCMFLQTGVTVNHTRHKSALEVSVQQ